MDWADGWVILNMLDLGSAEANARKRDQESHASGTPPFGEYTGYRVSVNVSSAGSRSGAWCFVGVAGATQLTHGTAEPRIHRS